jgi:hypothetical protein
MGPTGHEITFWILPNIMFAVVASNAEATTQTNGLLPLNFVSVFFGQSMFGTG